ncbi:MAG: bifunctional phosphoglucose/phosphomannose isomerase [Ignavibacteriae bacterium]|nr:bifunctional phosphoglucose/phosphomannose isomerase [Ignavibacteriota bacterium]
MTLEEIRSVDPTGMYDAIKGFPSQVSDAIRIGTTARVRISVRRLQNIVLTGLGGSAIGGDLLRSYLADELDLPFIVNRNYTLPQFVGPKTLVIVSSYSGNTEETIAAYKEALQRNSPTLCITSNGVIEGLARRKKSPLISIPGGFQPRAALGYSFFPLLITMARLGLVRNKDREIKETLALLQSKSKKYADCESAENHALRLAQQLFGRLGVVYSSTERFDAVGTRWRGQTAENGKSLMFGNVFPEMNHNELVGWKTLKEQMLEMQVFFLRDKDDHHRVQARMNLTKQIISEHTSHITEVWSEGRTLLARMFSLIYLGDWTSYYLAILNRVDPMPVYIIDYLKEELGKA